MNIWVLRSSYEDDHYAQTHMTEKGVLMGAVTEVSEYMYGGHDDDEIGEFEKGWPTSFGEDLNGYTREQLRRFLQAWWETLMDSGQPAEFQIYETQVRP
tara:strand:- start:31 stop:327 length:297 start_codon:yes stop_codon:yes gene_type:complete